MTPRITTEATTGAEHVTVWRHSHAPTWSLVLRMRRLAEAPDKSEAQKCHVRVGGGYLLPELHVTARLPTKAGVPPRGDSPMLRAARVPELGIGIPLPHCPDSAIDLPASEPSEHRFGCQMGMLHGRLTVDPASPASTATRRLRRDRRVRPPHTTFRARAGPDSR